MYDIDDPLPGFKWPVGRARNISAPAAKVWEIITTPRNLEWFHPFCARNPVTAWPGEDSIDEIHYLNGWIFERRFCRWYPGLGYDLEIGRPGGKSSYVSWRITPVTADTATLRITIYPYVLTGVPLAVRWLPHALWLRPRLTDYLESILNGLEWYVIHDEPVARNHFGLHPWFSK